MALVVSTRVRVPAAVHLPASAPPRPDRRLGIVAIIASATAMGFAGLFGRMATPAGAVIGDALTLGRMLFGAVGMLVILLVTGRLGLLRRSRLSWSVALGGVFLGLSLATYLSATILTSLSVAVVLHLTGPALATVMARLLLKERLSRLGVVSLLLSLVGMTLAAGLDGPPGSPGAGSQELGILLGAVSGVFYGASLLCYRYRRDMPSDVRSFWNFAFGGLGAGAMVALTRPDLSAMTPSHWVWAGGFFLVCGLFALTLLVVAGKHLRSAELSGLSYWEVVVAVLVGAAIYGEPLSGPSALGAVLVVVAAVLPLVAAATSLGPMIDPKWLRTDPDRVRRSQEARGESVELVDQLIAADEARRATIVAFETLRAEQKDLGKGIARAKGDEKARLLARTKQLSSDVKTAQAASDEAGVTFDALMLQVGNLVLDGDPSGGEDEGAVIETVGEPRDFAAEGFEPKDHLEIGELLGAIDMERGAKISGSRFYVLTGIGAQLEMALLNLAMAKADEWGFTPMIPPALVKPSAMEGTGFLGQAAQDVYHLPADDLYLVGTSEVALAAFHSNEILDAETLPRRYVAFSPCFRREAGSHGRDTRGIFRVHWFDKAEMFVHCRPEDAEDWHHKLLGYEKEFIEALEIPFQVLDVASGDLGLSAARKYDCYAWLPTQQRYREITSTSNCTQFQARRLSIRYRGDDGTEPVATLNGTLCAMTRMIIMLLENHQLADGSVRVPAALQPYLGGREVLAPVAS